MHQASTLPDLHYQQVLDNLARFADNPSALPWHVNFREGTAQITDSLSGGAAVDLGPPVTWFPQLLGSRTAVAQWGMTPVINSTELRLLRIAYRRAFGSPDMPDPEFLSDLGHELKNQLPSNVDQRDESELFYDYVSRGIRDYAEFDAKVATTNDDMVCNGPEAMAAAPCPWHGMSAASSIPSSMTWPGSDPAGSTSAESGMSPGTLATSAAKAAGTSGLGSKAARP